MRFRAKLNLIKLDKRQRPAIDEYAKIVIEQAARIWVRTALDIIPTWSGASRATLQALASAVDEHVAIDVRGDAPDRIALGRLYSSGGINKVESGHYEFYYETSLRYLIANENQNVKPGTFGLRGSLVTPTPYQFREAGNRAVKAYLDQVRDLPLFPFKSSKA